MDQPQTFWATLRHCIYRTEYGTFEFQRIPNVGELIYCSSGTFEVRKVWHDLSAQRVVLHVAESGEWM